MTLFQTFTEALAIARKWNAINGRRVGTRRDEKFQIARVEQIGSMFSATVYDCEDFIIERLGA